MEANKMENNEKKIRFRDLSGALKTAVVISYILGSIYAVMFAIGFIIGFIGAY